MYAHLQMAILSRMSNGLRVVILDHTSRRGKDWVYIGRANEERLSDGCLKVT